MGKPKHRLTPAEIAKIIELWESKSIDQIAEELGVVPNTIRKMVETIRKVDPDKCPPKPNRRRKREDVVREALDLLAAA